MKLIIATFILIHSWYEPACCNDADCSPINCKDVHVVQGGFQFYALFFPINQVKVSQDQGCHACYNGDAQREQTPHYCLYLPGTS